ncbi:MAG: response regulator [Myxococcota bacterium]|jgi:signal transduction histidine kinase/CheY-like chemotaxis protein|nr:response regulator [Myxococcota bacterium]
MITEKMDIVVLEHVDMACALLDESGRMQYSNQAMKRWLQQYGVVESDELFRALPPLEPELAPLFERSWKERTSQRGQGRLSLEAASVHELSYWLEPVEAGVLLMVQDTCLASSAARDLALRSEQRLQGLAHATHELSQARSVDGVIDVLSSVVVALLGCDGVSFALREGDAVRYLEPMLLAPSQRGTKVDLERSLAARVMRSGEALRIFGAASELPSEVYNSDVKAMLLVPVRRKQALGALVAFWRAQHEPSDDEEWVLLALADASSTALEKIRSLEKLVEGQARSRAVYEHLPHAAFVFRKTTAGFVLVDFNPIAESLTDASIPSCLGREAEHFVLPLPTLVEDLQRCYEQSAPLRREQRVQGSERFLLLTFAKIAADMVVLHAEDVSQRRRLEDELQQVQRIDAVGRLAAGLAHDFTNLLSVITSYAGFIRQELSPGEPMREDIEEILNAGRSATELTRQLLAFGRKQVLHLELLSMNVVVTEVEGMLRGFLPEDIDVAVQLGGDLGLVEGDATQLEQVIVNLALRARDAMPKGGTLTIRTKNTKLKLGAAALRHGLEPGEYVLLQICDSGQAMSEEMRMHLFEPFFASGETSASSALAMATVYGIVRQCGGAIEVSSGVEAGTCFELYFPLKQAALKQAPAPALSPQSETVLVVEDSDPMRRLVERMLNTAGYHVLTASGGEEALMLCASRIEPIALLLSDVVMPQMGGRELWERLSKLRPELRVLFMSGYPDEALVHHGVNQPGIHLIGKPFTAEALVAKVRQVLSETPLRRSDDPF